MKKLVSLFLLSFFSFSLTASAEVLESLGDQYEIQENIFVDQEVNGDYFGIANKISITSNIDDELFLIGTDINIKSAIDGDARIIGANIKIDGYLNDDLMIIGETVEISKETVISGNVRIFADTVTLDGMLSNNLYVYANRLNLFGEFYGDIEATLSGQLWIDKGANIVGSLSYSAPEELIIPDGTVKGKITFNETQGENVLVIIIKDLLFVIFGFGLIGILAIYLAPKLLLDVGKAAVNSFPSTLLYGFLFVIGIFVLAVVLMISGLGLPLGGLMFGGLILGLFISQVFAAISLSTTLIQKKDSKKLKKQRFVLLFLFSFLVLNIIQSALLFLYPPAFGFLTMILTFWGFGVLVQIKKSILKQIA